jgi:hypothetical protein
MLMQSLGAKFMGKADVFSWQIALAKSAFRWAVMSR